MGATGDYDSSDVTTDTESSTSESDADSDSTGGLRPLPFLQDVV